MQITIEFEKTGRKTRKKVRGGLSVKRILQGMNINPTVVLVTKNNELITEDAKLKNGDRLKILEVVSGG